MAEWIIRGWGVRYPGVRLAIAAQAAGLSYDRGCYWCGEIFRDCELVTVVYCGFKQSLSGVFHRAACLSPAMERIERCAEVGMLVYCKDCGFIWFDDAIELVCEQCGGRQVGIVNESDFDDGRELDLEHEQDITQAAGEGLESRQREPQEGAGWP